MNTRRSLGKLILVIAGLLLAAYALIQNKWKTPNMTPLSPRLQPIFEKTKTVCFGRFLIDVPESAKVIWGSAMLPWEIEVYRNDVHAVEKMADEKIAALKAEKTIYTKKLLFISEKPNHEPPGRLVTGFADIESLKRLVVDGYFKLNADGLHIKAQDRLGDPDIGAQTIRDMAKRLRTREDDEIPAEPGNCIEHAFLADKAAPDSDSIEHIRIGFQLKEFPDAQLSVYVAPANDDPESDSLEAQLHRSIANAITSAAKDALSNTKFFRKSPRKIHEWTTGYEVLMRSPDEDGSHSHHSFLMKFTGVPKDVFNPYADIQFQTGVDSNAAGTTKASLTDDEAIAVWDKITSTIRVRKPSDASTQKTSQATPPPRTPLGEIVATGRPCPQTGWWQCNDTGRIAGDRRRHLQAGEVMPPIVYLGEQTLWQKVTGEQPSYKTQTVWKLVDYDEADKPASVLPETDASTAHSNADDVQPQADFNGNHVPKA